MGKRRYIGNFFFFEHRALRINLDREVLNAAVGFVTKETVFRDTTLRKQNESLRMFS